MTEIFESTETDVIIEFLLSKIFLLNTEKIMKYETITRYELSINLLSSILWWDVLNKFEIWMKNTDSITVHQDFN